ncbi:histidine kinase [Streptomyces sp. DSM 41524]|uniref:histidine kinase n=1 Tax=Streptomyces asiaticus subsp. ignotus TaxID=3098222 RepID=A0ABU7QB16_9ACTN|nr:histidine kinase [Streptomyces sp. DSM 41524]
MAAVGCLLPHGSNETARSLRDGLAAAGLPWGAVAAVSALLASAAVGMLPRWRWPLFAVALLTWCGGQAWPVMCVASYTAATAYRRSLHMAVHTVAATMVLALPDLAAIACHRQGPGWSRVLLGTLAGSALFVWLPLAIGLWIGARRDALKGLRQRVEHQERERAARVEEARAQERARIARDMHDIVAHQVSLMVLHAGALEVNARDEATASGAAVIRTTAREALAQLRDVLGVLTSARDGDMAPAAPRAGLRDVEDLVDRSRAAGIPVSLDVEGTVRPLPDMVEHAAHRVVQEALTNVGKHAGRVPTEVGLPPCRPGGHRPQRGPLRTGRPPARERARPGRPAGAGPAARRRVRRAVAA